jgi:hypothetical protein
MRTTLKQLFYRTCLAITITILGFGFVDLSSNSRATFNPSHLISQSAYASNTNTGTESTTHQSPENLSSKSTDEQLDEEIPMNDIRKRPYLRFRLALNRKPKVIACFFSLVLIGAIALFLSPADIFQARDFCRLKFLRSFGIGFAAALLILIVARPFFLCEVGIPLAFALIAFLELGLVLGLVVAASLIGETVANALGASRLLWLAERPSYRSLFYLIIGALTLAITLLIPGIGHFPRLGTRLVVLIAMAGCGALLKVKWQRAKSL